MVGSADYVIVGGGTAGAVLANRLSEDGRRRVLLIEAGGEAGSPLVQIPAGFTRLLGRQKYDWCYMQEPDKSIGGRQFMWSAGKLLGGSSSINGQVYIRGTRNDYDRWADAGCSGWSFADCFPYFLKAEQYFGEPNNVHGQTGPLAVSPMRDPHPLVKTFLEACGQSSLPTLNEYCAGDMNGAFLSLGTQRNGLRCSTEKAYLRDARKRKNLSVITGVFVERIVFDGRRATGVVVQQDGQRALIDASCEVIVSAGTIGSPALLMRSGIGQGDELENNGISSVAHAPQVGANLQEHPGCNVSKFVNVPTYNSQTGILDMMRHVFKFLLFREGPLAPPAVQAMALARTTPDVREPDVQLHFLPLAYDVDADSTTTASTGLPTEPSVMINGSVCHPHSRGRVRLSKDGAPRIEHELIGDSRDVATLVGSCKLIEQIFSAPAWKTFIVRDRVPQPMPANDEAWTDYVRQKTSICYHPVGTCRMGSDRDAVVDTSLRVNGVDGLRVIDASVMPSLPSTNTNATTIMIAEKASELIRTMTGK